MIRIIITGGSGRLGTALKKIFPEALYPTHQELDITNSETISEYFQKFTFDKIILIHGAAYTSVTGCEENKDRAWKVNVEGTQNLVNYFRDKNCYFVYISTACVFHGDDEGYKTENDVPYPKNFYGLTKLLGECIVRQLSNYLIIRTNFVKDAPWEYPEAFIDRWGTYLFADDVASALKELIDLEKTGLVHVCGDREFTMYDLACYLSSEVKPISTKNIRYNYLTRNMTLNTINWHKYSIGLKNRKRKVRIK